MNLELHAELRRVAAAGLTTRYSDIAPLLGIHEIRGNADVHAISIALEEVSAHEHEAGHPLLSVVVVNETNQPGPGFFTMARRLGLMRSQDRDTFFVYELQAAHRAWAGHS